MGTRTWAEDLLFTSEEAKEGVILPPQAFDMKERLVESTSLPVGLWQKIYIVKPNLCIALAGNSKSMQAFMEELKMRSNYYSDWEIDKDIIITPNDINFKKTKLIEILSCDEVYSLMDI